MFHAMFNLALLITPRQLTFEFRSPNGARTIRLGGGNTLGERPRSPGSVPTMSS